MIPSFLLHADLPRSFSLADCCITANLRELILWNSGSWSHLNIRLNVSRPDLSLDQGLGFLRRSDNVPCDRQRTLCAKIAWGIEYRLSSAEILCARSLVLISSSSPEEEEEVGDFMEVLWRGVGCWGKAGWWRMVVGGRMGAGWAGMWMGEGGVSSR